METNQNVPRCHNCKFWQGNRNDTNMQGMCLRNPPQVAGLVPQQTIQGVKPAAISTFPTAHAMQWCGEYALHVVLQ